MKEVNSEWLDIVEHFCGLIEIWLYLNKGHTYLRNSLIIWGLVIFIFTLPPTPEGDI